VVKNFLELSKRATRARNKTVNAGVMDLTSSCGGIGGERTAEGRNAEVAEQRGGVDGGPANFARGSPIELTS